MLVRDMYLVYVIFHSWFDIQFACSCYNALCSFYTYNLGFPLHFYINTTYIVV